MIKKYLSQNFTDEEVKKLFTKIGKIQMITAPTGAGKTYFILQNVIKIAKGDFKPFGASKKKALLLANRSALKDQMKVDLEKGLNKSDFKSISEEQFVTKYVDILSYQIFAKKIFEDEDFLDNYKLIIADECHYFLNDYWNNTTQLTLYKLIEHSKDNTVLFFSATTEELKYFMDAIMELEYDNKKLYQEVINKEESKNLGFNDRLDILVTNDTLEHIMEQIPSNEKFIIFVNELMTKDKIEKLSKNLSDDNRLIGFVYSKWNTVGKKFTINSDMSKKYEGILKNEGFYDDDMIGIIANSAIDNGVNFKMEDLKHIILLNQYDFVQIQQFIGRKRHNPNNKNDRTNIYIISNNKAELEQIKNKCSKTIKYYEDYKYLSKEDFIEKYNEEITLNSVMVKDYENTYMEGLKVWSKVSDKITKNKEFPFLIAVTIKGEIEIYPNYCHIQKCQNKLSIINGVLEQLKYCTMAKFFEVNLQNYYSNIKLLEVKKSKLQKKYCRDAEIPKFLMSIEGKKMNKNQYRELREIFKDKWDVKHQKKFTALGNKLFDEFINKYGYCVFKEINKDRNIIYSIVKS